VRDQPSSALPSPDNPMPPGFLEALARAVMTVFSPPPVPDSGAGDGADFLTAAEFARRLGVSRETVRRLAIADVLPHTVVCRGARQVTRRFPRRFADDFAASGGETADLAGFAERWRARVAGTVR